MPGPFNMPPFSNGMPDFDKINKIPQPPLSPELMSMFLEDILVIALAVNGGTKELHQRHFLQLFPICLMK